MATLLAGNSVGQAEGLIQPREEKRQKPSTSVTPTALGMAWVSRAWSLDLGMMKYHSHKAKLCQDPVGRLWANLLIHVLKSR